MGFLNKLPGNRREPSGLERDILVKLPMFVAAGTAIPAFCYLLAPLYPIAAGETEKYLTGVAIYAVATVLTIWTAAFTMAIGCLVVVVMKGPAYVADRYELSDADQPRQAPRSQHRQRPSDPPP